MRKLKRKIVNVLLASAIGTAALGGALFGRESVQASALAAPSGVFTATSSATVQADETDRTQTAFSFPDGGKVSYRRDLAWRWYEGKDQEKFLSLSFGFKDVTFKTITFTFQTAPATASDDDTAENVVTFTSDGTNVTVKVNDGATHNVSDVQNITLSLGRATSASASDGKYAVYASGTEIGEFTNVGGSFADFKSNVLIPLTIEAKLPEDAAEEARTTVLFKSLNGQSFALDSETGAIAADTAVPVLVVNEELTGFTLGAKFDVDYTKIDVLDDSLQTTLEYYQYNPTDTAAVWSTLSTDASFSDTVYSNTTVLKEENKEFVAVRLKIEDDAHAGDDGVVYYFSWYTETTVTPSATATTENAAVSSLEYIPLTKNTQGPTFVSSFDFDAFQREVDELAVAKNAGDSAKLNLPSVEGMFEDDDTKYKGFKYTVYYKSKSSPSGTSKTASYNSLSIPVEKEGEYEFKIVAADKSGNSMTVEVGGETVSVTSDNVWDLSEIPSFSFKIKSSALSVDEGKIAFRNTTGIIDVTFELDAFDVEGPSGYSEDYALFYFDLGVFKDVYPDVQVDETVLSSIQYADLVHAAFDPSVVDDVAELYVKLYAEKLIKKGNLSGVTVEGLTEADENGNVILRKIGEKNSSFSESVYPDNKYEWDKSDKSFNPAHEGIYIAFGIFTHPELTGNTVGAYRVISVSATEDVIAGETQWLRNNLASVILFSIAAVLLVIIIVLLLIKPSDETLEDVMKDKKKIANDKK